MFTRRRVYSPSGLITMLRLRGVRDSDCDRLPLAMAVCGQIEASATSHDSEGRPLDHTLLKAVHSVLPPHPVIQGAYATSDHKREFLRTIFDDTAADYDRIERWLSLGTGRRYRRQALIRAGLRPGMRVADIAVGTGLVAAEALDVIGSGGSLVGVDPSLEMMRRAKDRLGIQTVVGIAEALPIDTAGFDFVSMGYALRHVTDLNTVFSEFHRVLKPGGRACILEITRPRTAMGRAVLRGYLSTVCPIASKFTKLAPRTPELWKYYWETIDKCVPAERIMDAMRTAGFINVNRTVSCGLFSEYTAATQ